MSNIFAKITLGVALAAVLLFPLGAVAADETSNKKDQDDEVVMNIGEMVVTDTNAQWDLPGSVDIIGTDLIQDYNAEKALDLLRLVPGVTIMNYNFGGVPNGFTMRGWYLPHGKGAVATVDGIPFNNYIENGDGSIDLNQLIVDDIEQVVAVKGPIDKRYGNWARAGSIHFTTRKRGDFLKAKVTGGDCNTYKGYASYGGELLEGKFNQIYSGEYYHTDGYRDNSAYTRKNAYGKWFYRPGESSELGLVLHTFDSQWGSPGYISKAVWEDDPKADNTKNDGGHKTFNEAQVHYNWDITANMPLEVKAWVSHDDYSRFWTVPIGAQAQQEYHYEQTILGTLANLGYELDMGAAGDMRLDFGGDMRHFKTIDERYNTTYRTRTGMVHDDEYEFDNLGFYTKANYNPIECLRLFGGLRYDTFNGTLEQKMDDLTRDLRDFDVWTWSTGAIFTFLENYRLYANYGTSFQLPVGEAGYNADAPDAAMMRQWEVGFMASPLEWLSLRYAYFQSTNDDEITQLPTGYYAYEGETFRQGHEIELRLTPFERFEFFTALTMQKATYEAGSNQGNDIRFIPDYIFTAGAKYTFITETAVNVWYRKVGDWYVTPANDYSAEGFDVVDLRISQKLWKSWQVSLDVNNLFDEQYSEFVLNLGGTNYYAGNDGTRFMVTLSYEY